MVKYPTKFALCLLDLLSGQGRVVSLLVSVKSLEKFTGFWPQHLICGDVAVALRKARDCNWHSIMLAAVDNTQLSRW